MRLFIGIDFPKEVKDRIFPLIKNFQKKYPEIKWEKKENLHLTLKFLGNVKIKLKTKSEKLKAIWRSQISPRETSQDLKLKKIIREMERVVLGVERFEIRVGELGYFLRNSLIVWLSVVEQGTRLKKLAKNLDGQMGKLGFRKEKRAFHPHVTLGRRRKAVPIGKWRRIAEEIAKAETGTWKVEVKNITLFESKLSRQGAVYKIIHEAKIIGNRL